MGKIKMFVCGPTVYDYMHIGNARTFVIFDAYAKWLRFSGVELEYIQNITDIDDKIIARAKEQGKDPLEFAHKWEQIFYEDARALDITTPIYKRAMDHIPEIINQVKRLIEKGHVYEIENDGYYFNLSTFADYGKLSGRMDLKDDDAISRIDENENKRNKGDFCVWKGNFETGRPGWHIEDTAITEKYFGPQYDIHGGAIDLIFPHHEAEIAIMESISGISPFVKKWMHAGFLTNKGKRMGKSNANFTTVREALKHYSAAVLRFYFLSAHYRSPIDFSMDNLKQAEAAAQRISEFLSKIDSFEDEMPPELNSDIQAIVATSERDFAGALDDDFNTPRAFAAIFDLMRQINPLISSRTLDQRNAKEIKRFFDDIKKVLGIVPDQVLEIPKIVQMLIDQRGRARNDKNYEMADELRKQIEEGGYYVDDTAYGALVKKK